jgi:signal transduction histidine kinase
MSVRAVLRPLRRPAVADALIAAAFSAFVVIELAARMDDGYRFGDARWNLPVLLTTTMALAARRIRPVAAVIAGYAPVLVTSVFVEHTIFFFGTLMPLLALTYSAVRLAPRAQLAVPVVATALVLVVVPLHQPSFDAGDYLFWAMLGGLAIGLGAAMRRLDQHRTALSATLAEQVHDQDLRERALLLEERRRIARELHDVVAHAVSVMVVQAGAARLDVGVDDVQARAGLLAVERAGRDALDDLRRLLGVLKTDHDDASAEPAPGLHMLPALLDRMREAGLVIRFEGVVPSGLPAGLDQSLYRIVQESLTNVLKHAGPTSVTLRVAADAAAVHVQVLDAGATRGTPPRRARQPGGHGLVGMRERAAVFGGSFEAGAHAGGWRVDVSIPVPAADPVRDPTIPAGTR